MTTYLRCPICGSESPESWERLLELARIGVARFLGIAREARVVFSVEQQRDIFEALVSWDTVGLPGEADWLVHAHADRAVNYAVIGLDMDPTLLEVLASMPPWNANTYSEQPWNCPSEWRVEDELKPLLKVDDLVRSPSREPTD